jgi:glycosyltransferase involved in cell wall biosynthesis
MKPPSSILYVSYDGLLEPLGSSQVLPYVQRLSERGFSMEVLSFEKALDLADGTRHRALSERLDASGVKWHVRRYHRRPSALATLYDVGIGILAGLEWSRRTTDRAVHARSYVAGLMGLVIKRACGARLVFDTRSFLVDERIDSGIWRRDSAVARVARRVERRLLQQADTTVVVTRSGAEAIKTMVREGHPAPVRVIPPCTDLDRFHPPPDRGSARAELGLPQVPIAVHIGALGSWYLSEETFAIGKAFARRSGGRFVVLTKELELAKGLDARMDAGALIRSVNHEEVPRWLAAADAGLALVRPDPAKRGSTPVKIGEYLACGLAVAATHRVGDLDEQFADSRVAFTFDPRESADAVAVRLLAATKFPLRVKEARTLAERYYSLDRAVDAYAEVYGELGVISSHDIGSTRDAS